MANILSETGIAIMSPLQSMWDKVVEGIPSLVGAIIVMIIGVFVAVVLGHLLRVLLEKSGLDDLIRKVRLTQEVGHTNVPAIAGEILRWYIIIIFLQAAVSLINLGTLSDLLNRFVLWLPNLIVAIVMILVGLAVAHYIEIKIVEHTKLKGVRTSGKLLKTVVVMIVVILAINQIGVDVSLLENILLIIIGALAVGVAVAMGIGLGFGLKKESQSIIKEIKKSF